MQRGVEGERKMEKEKKKRKGKWKASKPPHYWFLVSEQNHSLLSAYIYMFSGKQGKLSVPPTTTSVEHIDKNILSKSAYEYNRV